ncbi:hypothetical protein EON65_06800 [archaeon]|nr:MAG: hypothetical protein EON65_06800 [archaeon]
MLRRAEDPTTRPNTIRTLFFTLFICFHPKHAISLIPGLPLLVLLRIFSCLTFLIFLEIKFDPSIPLVQVVLERSNAHPSVLQIVDSS